MLEDAIPVGRGVNKTLFSSFHSAMTFPVLGINYCQLLKNVFSSSHTQFVIVSKTNENCHF